jgi:hypothetical protein
MHKKTDKDNAVSPEGIKYRSGIRLAVVQYGGLCYLVFAMCMICMSLPDQAKAIYGIKGYYGMWGIFALATWLIIKAWQWAFGPDKDEA